jgi:hypothetical protein
LSEKDIQQERREFARGFAGDGQDQPLTSPAPARPDVPDLARILDAWPTLPGHIKAAILALVATAR